MFTPFSVTSKPLRSVYWLTSVNQPASQPFTPQSTVSSAGLIEVAPASVLSFWASAHFSCPFDTGGHFSFFLSTLPVSEPSVLWSGLPSLVLTPKHRKSLELCSCLSPLRIISLTGVSSADLFPELHHCISSCMLVILPCRLRCLRHSCSDLRSWSRSSHFPSSVGRILVYESFTPQSTRLFYWLPFSCSWWPPPSCCLIYHAHHFLSSYRILVYNWLFTWQPTVTLLPFSFHSCSWRPPPSCCLICHAHRCLPS